MVFTNPLISNPYGAFGYPAQGPQHLNPVSLTPIDAASFSEFEYRKLLVFRCNGYAQLAGTVGGYNAPQLTVVTNLNDDGPGSLRYACTRLADGVTLRTYTQNNVPAWVVFKISPALAGGVNYIHLLSTLDLPPNTTIDGRGSPNVCVTGGPIRVFNQKGAVPFINVIVCNLRFERNYDDISQLLTFAEVGDGFWVNHCWFADNADAPMFIGQAWNVPIARGTIDWCRFGPQSGPYDWASTDPAGAETWGGKAQGVVGFDGDNPISIGDQNDPAYNGTGQRRDNGDDLCPYRIFVTEHHNWFHRGFDRQPENEWSFGHLYNNYRSEWGSFGWGSGFGLKPFNGGMNRVEAEVWEAWSDEPSSMFAINWPKARYFRSGVATSSSANTLVDTAKNWVTDQWIGYEVFITNGTGINQARDIISNTATALTVGANWTTNPAVGDSYIIRQKRNLVAVQPDSSSATWMFAPEVIRCMCWPSAVASTSTQIRINRTNDPRIVPGMYMRSQGCFRKITAYAGNLVTVSPAYNAAPTADGDHGSSTLDIHTPMMEGTLLSVVNNGALLTGSAILSFNPSAYPMTPYWIGKYVGAGDTVKKGYQVKIRKIIDDHTVEVVPGYSAAQLPVAGDNFAIFNFDGNVSGDADLTRVPTQNAITTAAQIVKKTSTLIHVCDCQAIRGQTGNVPGGTFKLGFNGVFTGDIAVTANAATIQAALDTIPALTGNTRVFNGSVDTTGNDIWGNTKTDVPFFVVFMGALADAQQPLLTADITNVTGTSKNFVVNRNFLVLTDAGLSDATHGQFFLRVNNEYHHIIDVFAAADGVNPGMRCLNQSGKGADNGLWREFLSRPTPGMAYTVENPGVFVPPYTCMPDMADEHLAERIKAFAGPIDFF